MRARSCMRAGATVALLSLCVGLSAGPITRQQAQQRAEQFLQNKRGSRRLTPVQSGARLAPRRTFTPTGAEPYFVFDRGQGEGFVIASGDDLTPPVLGYTDEGTFDYTTIPDNMRAWLDDRAQQIADLQASGATAADLPVAALSTHDAVEQLMDCKWNQGAPYYNECPMYFSVGRSVTGCVATAMAQILYYHRAHSVPETQADMPAYTGRADHETYGKLNVEGIAAGAPIDWDNMVPQYSGAGVSTTAVQRQAVADLMHYCGVSVKMDYSPSGSGAYSGDVPGALRTYFGYPSTCRIINRSDMSEESFDNLVYAELAKSCPVYLSGSNGSGGHAFVTDGYDGNLCYHINWGWGGSSDGFYLLANLRPGSQGIGGSSGGYSGGQAAVIGIQCEDYSAKAITFSDATCRNLCLAKWDTNGDGKLSHSEAAAVTDLGDTFKGASIKTFNELYHFTGLRALPDDAFQGCATLTTVRLPRHLKSIGARAFQGCTTLRSLTSYGEVTAIGEEAFDGCRALPAVELTPGLAAIGPRTFRGCAALTELALPATVTTFGDAAFSGCTKLAAVTFETVNPTAVTTGAGLFEGVNLSAATLTVAQGAETFFAAADQWREFGNLSVTRNLTRASGIPLAEDKLVYLYNVGTGTYLTRGEAYGTQAVAAAEPMRFRLGHTEDMPAGTYYLYSDDTGKTNHYLFRSNSDTGVGTGVRAVFVDGPAARLTDKTAHWSIAAVGSNVYTLQTPATEDGYAAGEYLGVQPGHATNYTAKTTGVYTDVPYADYALNCQWMFVAYDEDFAAANAASLRLRHLLDMADAAGINASREQAVYDDFNSTAEQLQAAQSLLRKRLDIMEFKEDVIKDVCLAYWDLDADGEMTRAEVEGVPAVASRFQGKALVNFDDFQQFAGVTTLSASAFASCSKLESIVLPKLVTSVGANAFYNCTALKNVELQENVTGIGANAFRSCTALTTLRVAVPDPSYITLGTTPFLDVDLSQVTLYVPYGTKALYAEAEVWKDFGSIQEMRATTRPKFSELKANVNGYLYNVGTRKYLNKGEAYGTQAVVALEGMTYQFRRTTSGGKTVYYLYSEETGKDNKVLFRTANDTKVGAGIRTCFVDGTSSTASYWNVQPVDGTDFYTLQPLPTDTAYIEGSYLGIQPTHKTSYTSSNTYGLYWDVPYETYEKNCQWGFISVADMQEAADFDEDIATLKRYLAFAAERGIEATEEQAVYDNFEATTAQVREALASLREKLHFITFESSDIRQVCLNNWDADADGELSYEEAAAVTDLGALFRGRTAVKSFDELRYFTALTTIPDEAFRSNSALYSLYVPEHVASIGAKAFTSCGKLRYIALLSPTPVEASASALSTSSLVFVPKQALPAYEADEYWSRFNLRELTGTPVVTADDASRTYGKSNSRLTFTVSGAPINGEPTLACEATSASEVGSYPITVAAGTITTRGAQFAEGALTVEKAPLTVTAASYERNIGEENPAFEFSYKGWKNRETADVLLQEPVATCEATKDSPAGEYEITLSGGDALNYEFEYISGVLTVVDPTGIDAIVRDGQLQAPAYDLQGRRIADARTPLRNLPKGVYLVGGRKYTVK